MEQVRQFRGYLDQGQKFLDDYVAISFPSMAPSSLLGKRSWRCEHYGPLGWIETMVKLLAIGIAFASLSIYDPDDREYLPEKIVQMIILAGLGALNTLLFIQRLFEKEIFGVVFQALVIIGHWVLFAVLVKSVDPGAFIWGFSFLYVMGEYIKLMFLMVMNEFQTVWLWKPVLFMLTGFNIFCYLILIIIQTTIYLAEYET